LEANMTGVVEARPLWRIASASMFDAVGFERDVCQAPRKLAAKPARALQASRPLVKRHFRDQSAAMETENQEFSARVRSDEAREAVGAFLDKHRLRAEAVQ
jgi:enoyl-CoA hydratase/carnithine racemase